DGNPDEKTPAISNIDSTESTSIKSVFGFILMMFGISMIITGVVWFMEDGAGVVVSQMAGAFLLILGLLIASLGALLYGNDRINSVLFWRPPGLGTGLGKFIVMLVLIAYTLGVQTH
ncbi:MAG: hypothetical protein QGH57_02600, partial [Candidatus Thalassarchaeaceae archaeon]|nr:hypothetical protein [Candidatus Thalassarchaeaceae archaeon]